jgi:Galactose oxidase, central domain
MERARKAFPILILVASGHVCIAQGNFTATGPTTVTRSGHTATLLTNGKVLIAGGWTAEGPGSTGSAISSAELYDPSTGKFSRTGGMTANRQGHTATLLADGRVLIAGGANFAPLTSAELYEPATGTFTETGAMLQPRSEHVAALLPNGKVLVAGGGVGASAEIYDPVSRAFTRTADMHNPVFLTSMALLLSTGKVFIGGGSTSELYDPATGAFDTTGGWHAVVSTWPDAQALLTNGKVLVSGGDGNASFGATVWGALYDPGTGNFAATGDMNTAREGHNATTLPDGTALITGGQNNYGQTISAAEVYNPSVGGFTPTGSMITDRLGHTATLLNSGQVLITGGVTVSQSFPFLQWSYLASAELYSPTVMIRAPMLFSLSSDGKGQGAIWDGITGKLASSSSPAIAGEILSMYTRELGNVIPPQVAVGGRLAEIQYFGDAPGYPGYIQVNFRVPDGITPGSAVPVRLIYLGRSSNEVTIAVN